MGNKKEVHRWKCQHMEPIGVISRPIKKKGTPKATASSPEPPEIPAWVCFAVVVGSLMIMKACTGTVIVLDLLR